MSFITENSFLKGTQQLSAVDTHYEGTADLAPDAASSQTLEGFVLSPNYNSVTYPDMNRASVKPGLFGELPVDGPGHDEPSLSEIIHPEGMASLTQDLFEGIRRAQSPAPTTPEPDEAHEIANIGNLFVDMLAVAKRNSGLS